MCIVEANPPPKTDLEMDNPQLRFVKDGQTVMQDERYLSQNGKHYCWRDFSWFDNNRVILFLGLVPKVNLALKFF